MKSLLCRIPPPLTLLPAAAISFALVLSSCASNGTTTGTTNATATNAYAIAYQGAKYNLTSSGGTVTVTFPSSCSMTFAATGLPYTHSVYYLTPVTAGGTIVATTASGIQLGVTPYASVLSTGARAITGTFNICPTKASSTTATGMGAIGVMFSGTSIFNPYEATGTVAMGDNASYTFASTACGGSTCTASFIDTCNSHAAGGMGANAGTSSWHFHAVPPCWTSVVDGTGPSHIIGIALDGFPIYGGYDINGAAVNVNALDSCNGITSATPEFPGGAYHYVLPVNTTTKQSSINCYSGAVDSTLSAAMQKLACKMPMLLANGKMRLPDGREVSRKEADVWMQQGMPGMQMAGNTPAADAPEAAKKDAAKGGKLGMPGM